MATTTSGNQGQGENTGPAGTKADTTTKASTAQSSENQTSSAPVMGGATGLVYNLDHKKRKRKKRKYSSGLKDAQKVERGFTKASRRLSRALEQGLRTYSKRRDKSARKRRDGAIRDGLENWSRGLGRALRVSSKAPFDLAKQVNTRRFSRNLRDTIELITPPLFR